MRSSLRVPTVSVLALGLLGAAQLDAAATPAASDSPARAAAPVTVGVVSSNTAAGLCPNGPTTVLQTATTVGSYVVPTSGVVTKVHYNANAQLGHIRAVFFVPGSQVDHWTVVGKSDLLPIVPGNLNIRNVRVPVQAGWQLGLYVSAANMNCNGPTANVNDKQRAAFFDPGTSSDFGPGVPSQGYRANIAVDVEPDADGDGYGDLSQDACPQSKLTQAACPVPDTKVTKKPEKSSTNRQVKIKFSSSPGSTFTCAVDGKAAKPCKSPFKKRFKYGRHKVLITATSAYGIVDPTPAKVKFRIDRPA